MTPTEADPILDLIPQGYKGIALAILILTPIMGRAYQALKLNGGLKGVWNSIIFGTNTPKLLIASLCLMSLTSCAAIAKKTGMSAVDLFSITSGAAVRLQAEAERLKAEIKAAQDAENARLAALEVTAAKQPVNVQP